MSKRWIQFHPEVSTRWEYGWGSDEYILLGLIAENVQSLGATRKEVKLQPGECLMSRSYIRGATGWTDQHVRTVLLHLIDTRQITVERTTRKGNVLKLHPDGIFTVTGQESKPKQVNQDEEDDDDYEDEDDYESEIESHYDPVSELPELERQAFEFLWKFKGSEDLPCIQDVFEDKNEWLRVFKAIPADVKRSGKTLYYLVEHCRHFIGMINGTGLNILFDYEEKSTK